MQVITAAIVAREGRFLLTCRRDGDDAGGLWEFPGGGVEDNETPDMSIIREMAEETGLAVRPVRLYQAVLTGWGAVILFYLCVARGEARPIECSQVRWVRPEELSNYPTHADDERLMVRLAGEAGEVFNLLQAEEEKPWPG